MKFRLPLIFAAAVLCGVVIASRQKARAATRSLPPAHQELTIRSGGLDRHCLIHLPPAYDNTKPLPLVMVLHGMGGTGAGAVREMGWSAEADLENFIVAYPDASRPDATLPPSLKNNPQAWNDGSGRFHAGEHNIDDVAFIRALLERLTADYRVDRRRIFVTGFSNGASMAFRIGAELSDRVAAIAPVAGACWTETVKPIRGVSVFYITGTSDPLNPLDGGFPKMAFGGGDKGGRPKPAVLETIGKWAKALDCPESPAKDETTHGVRTRRYGPGRNGAEIAFITVEGLGHIWAGGVNLLPEFMVGKPTDKIKATDVIWDFFRAHPTR